MISLVASLCERRAVILRKQGSRYTLQQQNTATLYAPVESEYAPAAHAVQEEEAPGGERHIVRRL